MKAYLSSFAIFLASLSAPATLNAATVVISTSQHGSQAGGLEISVFDGNSYINGDVTSTTLSNVIDYAFFQDSPGTADLSGASNVLPSSVTSPGTSSSRQDTAFYTTNNPTSLTPNASFNQHTVGTNNSLSGTISFAGLPGGTNEVNLYLIHGGWFNFRNFSLTDGTDTWTETIANGAAREQEYVTRFTISDFSLSDSFTYTLSGSTNNPTFIGVIATQAIPEPKAALLGALGILLLLRRRR